MSEERIMQMKDEFLNDVINMSVKNTSSILDKYKIFLKRNNLCYSGKILEIDPSIPSISFTKEFETWCFNNAAILAEEVTLVSLLGEDSEYRNDQESTRRVSRKNRKGA